LRGVSDTGRDSRGQDHADGRFRGTRANNEGSLRTKLAATRKQDDVAEEFCGADFGAVLVVDFAVDVIGVGALNEMGARFEAFVGPGFETQAILRLRAEWRARGKFEKHELAAAKTEVLLFKGGVERSAERHELGLNALDKRRGAENVEHFEEEFFANGDLIALGRSEETADEAFLVFKDVKAIADGLFAFHCGIASKRMRIDELTNQVLGRAVIPIELFAPMVGLVLEQRLQSARMNLPQILNLHSSSTWPRLKQL